MRRLVFISILLSTLISHYHVNGQAAILVSAEGKFYDFDIVNGVCVTKEKTSFCNLNVPGFSVAQYKNKVYYNTTGGELYETDLVNPALCKPLSVFTVGNAMTADKNGTLYWVFANSLYRLPNGWTQPENLGALPFTAAGDLIFYGDKLLMAANPNGTVNNFSLVEINIASPPASKVYMETPGYSFFGIMSVSIGCNDNKVFAISSSLVGPGSDIVEIDIANKKIVGIFCSVNFQVYDAASATETGEVKGININSITVKPQCDGLGLGEIGVAATSATAAAKLFFSYNNNPSIESGLFPNLTSGNYAIKVTSSDGCSKDTFATVPFIERLRVSTLTRPDTCGALNGAVEINPISNHTGFRFSLENAAYVAGNVFNNLGAGIKSLKVIETNGCVLDTSFVVGTFQPPIPVTSLNISSANCSNADGTITVNYTTGANIQGARINGGIVQNSNQFTNLLAGMHQIQIITASCIYDTTVTVPLQSTPAPAVSYITNSPDCGGKSNGSLQINLTGTVAPYTYSFNNSPYTNETSYRNLTPGNYPVAVKDAQGCIFTGSATIQPYIAKPVNVQWNMTPADCWQGGGKITVTVTGSEAPYFYRINNQAYQAGQQATGLTAGNYMALIRNGNNCLIDSVQVTVTEQNTPGVVCDTVYVPTGFTPNADGKNDILKPTAGSGINNFIFRVYNRIGQVIFETRQSQKGWNGRFKGLDQPQGAYVWTFSYTLQNGQTKVFRGTTVLIR
ncbi:gliding motility-associated C-terminal domain-containing protein [Sediminibacterium sp.]|uniref:T9SS type B sorting domain-containing protein n=1 Tax=Sediminibacterium sp. TaxID=1917865 RepID=UPI0025D773C6|nr:gliding motility-associated C-terminal domain-containing protein [Sediminibacterium sp.]MBW0178726.1 gliding motility-associated C-terminal domain-containing protein [Sediminibacterium sp.]